ncbi:porin [Aquibium sp. ELW1220]|uniref:porin n=1 Tax=Aquibium sp. ELW1220 TaxID=2976766 RepID=UPI0025B01CCB|nr:porin [Aquibium sp. ELW1220]MDN2583940.1 porin [Aquibium sp. ELW1220]
MNIKSLLLGSAAALVAVTGARAADAIVIAEPEPVEYVRVCDAYGAGFFYIPGTETCLKFDGYVRMQIGASGGDRILNGELADVVEGWRFTTRARLNVDARSDTEWGTLRGYMRIQADATSNADAGYGMDQAIVQLGGFYVGYTESAWSAPWGLPGISRFGIMHTDAGGEYAYQQRQQIGYTFSGGNGVFGSIVLEDDTLEGEGYMPDVVGVLGISQGWGGVWGKVAYDESAEAFNVMAGMQYNIPNMAGSNIRLGGFWAEEANRYALAMPVSGRIDPTGISFGTVEWSVVASYNHKFNAQWSATIGAQYFEEFGGDNAWMVQGAVVWAPVTNFEVRLEGSYADEENAVRLDDGEAYSGFLRFTRYF